MKKPGEKKIMSSLKTYAHWIKYFHPAYFAGIDNATGNVKRNAHFLLFDKVSLKSKISLHVELSGILNIYNLIYLLFTNPYNTLISLPI